MSRLLVTADGYVEQRSVVQVASHLATVDFDLQLSGRGPQVGGTYTLE